MNSEPKVLLVVEGDSIEAEFFGRISAAFGIRARIVPYRTNIYRLYESLRETGFSANVCGILRESAAEGDKSIFDEKYAAIYLIYDADFQHCEKGENKLPIDKRIEKNLPRLAEMAGYFVDETDDTVGKLFINYPMMEAYKDCDSFFEEKYKDRIVQIDDLMHNGYKRAVSQRKVCGRQIGRLSKSDFLDIVRCALYKYAFIIGMGWGAPAYPDFIAKLFPSVLLDAEKPDLIGKRVVNVIGSSVLFVIDYKGNKDGFYDEIANDTNKATWPARKKP